MKNNIQALIRIVKDLNYILNGKQKKGAIKLFSAVIIASLLELLSVTLILPFVQAVTEPDQVLQNKYFGFLAKQLHINGSGHLLILIGSCLILLYLVKNIFLVYSSYVQYDFATRIQMELSVKMLSSYLNRPYIYFTETNSSEIIRGCSADIASVYNIVAMLTDLLSQGITVVAIGIFLIYTDPVTAISVLILMMVILLGIVLIFKPIIKKAGRDSLYLSTMTTKALYQSINGIKEILVMQRKNLFLDVYKGASDESRKITRKYNTLNACPDRIVEGICIGGIIGIVCFRLLNSGTDMMSFIPQLAAFAMGAFKVLPSIGKIASRINVIIFSVPGLDNVYQNIQEVDAYFEKNCKYQLGEHYASRILSEYSLKKELKLNHIFWKYQNSREPVLKDVSITIQKGESVAFIGASGAGKTTLSDILLGLIKPLGGTVELDGIDVYKIPEMWSSIVGYVPQSIYLVDDTVRNNIAFGLKEGMIDDGLIWDALGRAQLKKFIQELPSGLDTIVGERGVKFSGGQRQRIAIARALYNKPQILVLDEATASLDNETERAVMESIDALQGQITLIIVAHRLTTIRNCDKIYEISNGVAIEKDKAEVFGYNV